MHRKTHLSYRLLLFATSDTALCGTTGTCRWYDWYDLCIFTSKALQTLTHCSETLWDTYAEQTMCDLSHFCDLCGIWDVNGHGTIYDLCKFLRYGLAFGTRVLKTCVPERAFWRILFSNNLWFIKFTRHDTSARLPGWSGFGFIIQPSKHDSGASTGSNGGWSHQEIVANPFSGGQKKDRQGSEGLKATINSPAFGTRVPQRAFCVLRFGLLSIRYMVLERYLFLYFFISFFIYLLYIQMYVCIYIYSYIILFRFAYT